MGEWRLVKIGDFLHRAKCPVALRDDEDYKLVTVRMHHNGVVLREMKKGKLIGSNMYRVRAGQFILSGIDARHGAFGIIPDELDGAIVTNDFWYFDVDEAVVSRDFFLWLTTTPLFLDACIKSSEGTTNRRRLQAERFYSFAFRFPDIAEQHRLAEQFAALDATHSALKGEFETQITFLKQLRQAILQEAVEGKLTADWRKQDPVVKGDPQFDAAALLVQVKAERERLVKAGKIRNEKPLPPIAESDKPFDLPEGWVWCRLGEICSKIGSGSTPSGSNYAAEGIPFFRSQNIHDKGLVFEDIKFISNLIHKKMNGTAILPGDLLLNITGGSLGRCALVPDKFKDGNVSQHVCIVRPIKVSRTFGHKLIFSPFFQKLIFESTTGAGREGLPKYNLELFSIPLPPLAEQQVIVARVDSLMAMIDELEKQVAERKEQAQMLMQVVLREAFTSGDGAVDELTVMEPVSAGAAHTSPDFVVPRKTRARRVSPLRKPRKPALDVSLPLVAEPFVSYSPRREDAARVEQKRHTGHDMYNKAALAAYITAKCSDAQRPVGKVKVMKLYFLIQRKAEVALTESFVRRAAGPVDDAIHQAINLAGRKGWLKVLPKRGKMIPIIPGANPRPAFEQVKKYFGEAFDTADQMLETMKSWGWEALERWATVEPLARELMEEGKEPTCAAIKAALAADPVWKEKLKKEAFSDANIASTLRGLREFGFLPDVVKEQRQPASYQQISRSSPAGRLLPPVVGRATSNIDNIPQRIQSAMQPGGDYSRAELLEATSIGVADWTWAIRQLRHEGMVVQIGEKRGARYRLS